MLNPTELLQNLNLWISFLEKHNQLDLLKQANATKMKLEGLESSMVKNGQLSSEQEIIFGLCLRDYEYIQQAMFIIRYGNHHSLH